MYTYSPFFLWIFACCWDGAHTQTQNTVILQCERREGGKPIYFPIDTQQLHLGTQTLKSRGFSASFSWWTHHVRTRSPTPYWGGGGWAGLGACLQAPSRQFSRRSSCLGSSPISLLGPMLWFECGFLKEKIPYFTVTPIWLAVIRETVISKRSGSIQNGTGLTEMQL